MNIFLTSFDPVECARDLDTRRLSKMILETCQLLSTAKHYRINDWGFLNDKPVYKPTHKNHPCTIWARESIGNYCYLVGLLCKYAEEYYRRKDKHHKSILDHIDTGNLLLAEDTKYAYDLINTSEKKSIWDTFPNCARSKGKGLDFTHLPIIEAYREYLNYQWFNTDKYKPTWYGDYTPSWAKGY